MRYLCVITAAGVAGVTTTFVMEYGRISEEDIDSVMRIVEAAKRRLRDRGVDQWQRGYPCRESIEADVVAGVGMALRDEDGIAAYGAVIFTGEPAYDHIRDGRWLTAGPYAVVHRLCVAEGRLGRGCATEFMRRTEEYVRARVDSIRIDTHPDNIPMQGVIRKAGFTYCGDVTIESRRLAFEKPLQDG